MKIICKDKRRIRGVFDITCTRVAFHPRTIYVEIVLCGTIKRTVSRDLWIPHDIYTVNIKKNNKTESFFGDYNNCCYNSVTVRSLYFFFDFNSTVSNSELGKRRESDCFFVFCFHPFCSFSRLCARSTPYRTAHAYTQTHTYIYIYDIDVTRRAGGNSSRETDAATMPPPAPSTGYVDEPDRPARPFRRL